MKIRLFLFTIFAAVLVSCTQHEAVYDGISILSPIGDWYYTNEDSILFSTNLKSEEIIWTSSKDGIIGKGTQVYKKLSIGNHQIVLHDLVTGLKKCVSISVSEKKGNKTITSLMQRFPLNFETKRDFGIYTLDCNVVSLKINLHEMNTSSDFGFPDCYLKDISCSVIEKPDIISRSNSRSVIKNNEVEKFLVINTDSQLDAHLIDAKLLFANNVADFYITDMICSERVIENVEKCIKNFELIIYPRLCSLWGYGQDINGDEKITILFSSTINKENNAVGFFNCNDFYKKNEDIDDESYNPYSNERDIIYLAIPDESNMNYTVGSVSATLAHEMTHYINYSNKTYLKQKNGLHYEIMDLAIDEGLSHLAETLCGFGESGGNQQFVNYYLAHSLEYSFVSQDIYGNSDSVGRRGAVCLFLEYLFMRAGGISFFNFPENESGQFSLTCSNYDGNFYLVQLPSVVLPSDNE